VSSGPLADVRLVRVGSLNPPKLEGVRSAFAAFASEVAVEGVAVGSGVPEQPVGFGEIVTGARQRADEARRGGECDLAVGYEDGLVELPGVAGAWFNVGCAAVSDGRRVGLGLSSGFAYPPDCSRRAVAGREPIGELFDRLWQERRGAAGGAAPSALSLGNVGRLTAGALTRAEYTRQAVLCALTAFLQPDLYGPPGAPS
jgi:inosine/xanthosine triphosphatase